MKKSATHATFSNNKNAIKKLRIAAIGVCLMFVFAATAFSGAKPHRAPAAPQSPNKELTERMNEDEEAEVYEPLVPNVIRKTMVQELRAQFPPDMSDMRVGKTGGQVSLRVVPGPGEEKSRLGAPRVYSMDAKRGWRSEPMSPDATRPEYFVGASSGSSASPRVADEKGRTSLLASCRVSEWPPQKRLLEKGCMKKAGPALEQCAENALPVGCLFPLGKEAVPIDDKPSRAGDNLDMLESYFGFDDKYLYGAIIVQRAIAPGSLTPPTIHQYGFVIIDPRKIYPATEQALPQGGVLARYVPLGNDSPDFIAACAVDLDALPGREKKSDKANIECQAMGPFLFVKVNRAAYGMEKSKEFFVMAHTGIISGLEKKDFSFINRSAITKVYVGALPAGVKEVAR